MRYVAVIYRRGECGIRNYMISDVSNNEESKERFIELVNKYYPPLDWVVEIYELGNKIYSY